MPAIIDYLLKLSICLSVVYLFYYLVLQKLTFYNWNRWYLLGYTLLSFIIPLIDIMPSLQKKDMGANQLVRWVPVLGFTGESAHRGLIASMGLWDWLLAGFCAGMLVLVIRFIIKLVSFKKISKKATIVSATAPRIYQVDAPIMPFSFGNSIYINTDMHDDGELEEIIRHEFVHVKQKHTTDMMWSEFLCIVNWYNPFVWLLRHAITQNLEFIADNKVVQNGYDKTQYQFLLLKVMGNREFAFASNFNFSSLKKRIIMMNTVKTAKVHLVKFLFLLPVVAVLLLSFRKEMKKAEAAKVARVNTVIVKPEASMLIAPEVNRKLVMAKAARHTDTIPEPKVDAPVNKMSTSIRIGGNPAVQPLFILDGVPTDENVLHTINPNTIESVSILKDASATTLYGSKGANGVVLITTKTGLSLAKADTVRLRLRPSFNRGEQIKTSTFVAENGKVKMTAADGSTLVADKFEVPVEEGRPAMLPLSGKVTGTGIDKPAADKKPLLFISNDIAFKGTNDKEPPLFIVDGKKVGADEVEQMKPNTIKSFSVLKGPTATNEYGDDGRNGVIIISTKKSDGEIKVVQGYPVKAATDKK